MMLARKCLVHRCELLYYLRQLLQILGGFALECPDVDSVQVNQGCRPVKPVFHTIQTSFDLFKTPINLFKTDVDLVKLDGNEPYGFTNQLADDAANDFFNVFFGSERVGNHNTTNYTLPPSSQAKIYR